MLNPKERTFALEYIKNHNAYQSALKAGYSINTAKHATEWINNEKPKKADRKWHLPYKPELVAYINEKLEEIESAKVADAKEVFQRLTAIARGEESGEQVVVEGVGEGCSEARKIYVRPSVAEKTKALTELAKLLGLERSNVNLTGQQVVIVDDCDQ